MTYALKDTPCGEVLARTACCYPAKVCELFPNDAVLRELQAESYSGVTLFNHAGHPIGLIAVIGRQPLATPPLNEAVLQLVAIRAAGELERLDAEDILRESEQKYRRLIETANEGVVVGDADLRITLVNSAMADMLGRTPQELLGKPLADFLFPEDATSHEAQFAQRRLGRDATYERRLRRKDGTVLWTLVSAKALVNADGSFAGSFGMFTDITKRKEVEADLLRTKEAAEAASRAKSEFLANMSHEIRTPLNGILGMLQLLQTTLLDKEQNEYAGMAIQASHRLTRLLTDILDLSRIEAGRLVIQAEPFSLAEALRMVEQLFAPAARQTGLAFAVLVDPDIPARLLGDTLRVQQVLNNLVGNAFKFTNAGSVTVEVQRLPSRDQTQCRVLFSVSDTGCGIPEALTGSIFMPFTQGDVGYTRSHQGAGLGLTICKQLTRLMGGDMTLDSQAGAGTTVFFTLPFALPHRLPGPGAPAPAPPPAHLKNLRILLADDDPISLLTAQRLLEKAGAAVVAAKDGREALARLGEQAFDLILMDVQMPVVDGVAATRAIRGGTAGKDMAGIPIIAMTAYAMVGDKEKFLAAGMDGYLAKPVVLEQLWEVIDKTMFQH